MNGPAGGAAPSPRRGGGGERSEPEGQRRRLVAAYIAKQEDAGNPTYVTVCSPKGELLAKLGSVSA